MLVKAVHSKREAMGSPGGPDDKEPTCQGRRRKSHGVSPWVGEMP